MSCPILLSCSLQLHLENYECAKLSMCGQTLACFILIVIQATECPFGHMLLPTMKPFLLAWNVFLAKVLFMRNVHCPLCGNAELMYRVNRISDQRYIIGLIWDSVMGFKVAIVYYSLYGRLVTLANVIAEGARRVSKYFHVFEDWHVHVTCMSRRGKRSKPAQ